MMGWSDTVNMASAVKEAPAFGEMVMSEINQQLIAWGMEPV